MADLYACPVCECRTFASVASFVLHMEAHDYDNCDPLCTFHPTGEHVSTCPHYER